MSPLSSEYSQLDLDFYPLEDNHSHTPKKPSIAAGKKYDEVEDSINLLLEKDVMRQRDEMMDNFAHLLEGYFCVQFFFYREKITFTLLNSLPHVKH
jgi:hypothetical protein